MADKVNTRRRKRDRDGVRRRDDCGGRYEIQWQAVDPRTGRKRRFRELLETTSYNTARLERSWKVQASMGGLPQPRADITLNHFAEKYLEAHKHQKDFESKKLRIMSRILPELGDRPLATISVQEYEGFRVKVVGACKTDEARRRREKTANRYMAALKHMIRWGVETLELVPEEVLTRVRRSKQYRESGGRLVFFYLTDVGSLLGACSNPLEKQIATGFLRSMILLALGTGIRRGDLVKLRWRDVDLRAGTIYVGGESGADTKGGVGYYVEIGGIARLGLEEARRWLDVNGKPSGKDNYVIDWRSRDRLLWLFRRAYSEASEAAGLDRSLVFHSLRHTYGTWALAHGENIVNVKSWMGHANIATTQRYAHAIPRGRIPTDTVNPLDVESDAAIRKLLEKDSSNILVLRSRPS